MLRRISVQDVQSGKIRRGSGRTLVVVMRFYPRFLKRELVDEYQRALAPPADLFREFKDMSRKIANHGLAFEKIGYERRFELSAEGLEALAGFSARSPDEDIFFVCQCRDFDRCHCDLLLVWAREKFGARVGGLIFEYPEFSRRIAQATA